MRDILPELRQWVGAGERVALATVVGTWGSAPRQPGAKMAISASGKIAGSVSGGCLEGAVFEEGMRVLRGAPPKRLHYGVTDDLAWEVGLSCGGEIDLLLEELGPAHRAVMQALEQEAPVVLASRLGGGEPVGAEAVLPQENPGTFGAAVGEVLQAEEPKRLELPGKGEFFLEPFPRPSHLYIFGGAHIAIPLVSMAKGLSFRVTVVDARGKFADRERFPQADEVIHAWPDEVLPRLRLDASSYVVILTHDPKFDDPTIKAALATPARYIGAIGSRKTHRERVARLLEQGMDERALRERVRAPIGLDIGARSAEETALAILAEMVAARHGKGGGAMTPAPGGRA
jgi:xanthine dehydrogenase accessory factor